MKEMASHGMDKVDETMVHIFDWDNTPLRKREFNIRIQQSECEGHESLAEELVVRVVRMKAQRPKWRTVGLCSLNRLRGETFQAAHGRVSKDRCWFATSFGPPPPLPPFLRQHRHRLWIIQPTPAMFCSLNLCD